jgi:hypothetical protein
VTPTEIIADLDASLREDGEDIRLVRYTLGPGGTQIPFEVTCRAFVRGYEPSELIGAITQQDSKVILSPTQIIAAQWTSGRTAPDDKRVPMVGNRVFIAGRARNIGAAVGKYVANELVRIELSVKG